MTQHKQRLFNALELLPMWQRKPHADNTAAAPAPVPAPNVDTDSNPLPDTRAETPVKPDFASMDLSALASYTAADGDPQASWLFVADPLTHTATQPFAGEAGALFDKMLAAIQLQRHQSVYLTHFVHPALLQRQLALIQPKLMVVMGEVVAQQLFDATATLAQLRGQLRYWADCPCVVSFAPEHLLQQPQDKAKAWADLCLARDTMATIKS